MSAPDNSPDTRELAQGHKELSHTMTQLSSGLARLEGKIDTQTQLLERFSERQDRTENRISEVEREMRQENRRLEEKHNNLATKVWMGCGAAALIGFVPAILKIAQALGTG